MQDAEARQPVAVPRVLQLYSEDDADRRRYELQTLSHVIPIYANISVAVVSSVVAGLGDYERPATLAATGMSHSLGPLIAYNQWETRHAL